MEMKEILRRLCEAPGAAGEESGARAAARQLLEQAGCCEETPLGSLLCTVRTGSEGAPRIMLDAHLDEIGLMVSAIDEEGFIKVVNCGGIDRRLLPASAVIIHGREPVSASVCALPEALAEKESKKPGKIDSYTLDTGLGAARVKELIAPGDRVTADVPFCALQNGLFTGKALDNRAGCAAIIRAAQLLSEEGPDCTIVAALTSMEEVGGVGAQTAAYQIAPSHAFVVDVSFGHCEGVPRHKTAALGSGPMIGMAPCLSTRMARELADCAGKNGIPFSFDVMGGRTGTNADDIASSRGGVRTALLSIPQRNMHTPVEVVCAADVEALARLIASYIREWTGGTTT
ncbi:MAG: M42 family metallopeptidase [Provencibacterium sp.]|jgi:putative aminopeptidase FrvX|nr:M42 family metallopeptidase [Provencibacterium sp.]